MTRDLFAQRPLGTDIWPAHAWCFGALIVADAFAVTYRRRIGG